MAVVALDDAPGVLGYVLAWAGMLLAGLPVLVIGVVLILLGAAAAWMVVMPGSSYEGALPALTDDAVDLLTRPEVARASARWHNSRTASIL